MSAIGHQGVFRLNGWSRQIHTEFQGFRVTWDDASQLATYTYGAITLYGATFQRTSTSSRVSYCVAGRQTHPCDPTTPHTQPLPGITCTWFGLIRFRSPLLSESLLFSLPVGTEMFHFPTFPPHTLYIQMRVTRHHSCWVSPFGHPRITARLTAPRGLSQPPTSFIGSWCQGIHHVPFIACLTNTQQKLQRLELITSRKTRHPHPPHTRGRCFCRVRCSRPLSNSQTTSPPSPQPHHPVDLGYQEASSRPVT